MEQAIVDELVGNSHGNLVRVKEILEAHPELINAAAGADVNANAEAAAPIHGAVMGGSGEMVRFLIESGADLSLPDYKGRDARTLATEMGRNDLASLIPTRA